MAAKLSNDQKIIRIFGSVDWAEGARLIGIARETNRLKAKPESKPREARKPRSDKGKPRPQQPAAQGQQS